uniref:Uncharacterized protein n=1 Tax=Arundo donax TaxID=35708 RepID=A0A0A8Y9Q3_ARUDO
MAAAMDAVAKTPPLRTVQPK